MTSRRSHRQSCSLPNLPHVRPLLQGLLGATPAIVGAAKDLMPFHHRQTLLFRDFIVSTAPSDASVSLAVVQSFSNTNAETTIADGQRIPFKLNQLIPLTHLTCRWQRQPTSSPPTRSRLMSNVLFLPDPSSPSTQCIT